MNVKEPGALFLGGASFLFLGTDDGRLVQRGWTVNPSWSDHGYPPGGRVATSVGAFIPTPGDPNSGRFFLGTNDGRLMERRWDGQSWQWTDHGRPPGTAMATAPGALLSFTSGGALYAKFFLGTADGRLMERYWAAGTWGWTDHGRPPDTTVATTPGDILSYPGDPSAGRFFLATSDGRLMERYWDENRRTWAWLDHGTPPGARAVTAPGALLHLPGDSGAGKVFVGTSTGHLLERYWDNPRNQHGWTDHGLPPGGAAVATAPGALFPYAGDPSAARFFVTAADGRVAQRYWDEDRRVWDWIDHGTPQPGERVATSPGATLTTGAQARFAVSSASGSVYELFSADQRAWSWRALGFPPSPHTTPPPPPPTQPPPPNDHVVSLYLDYNPNRVSHLGSTHATLGGTGSILRVENRSGYALHLGMQRDNSVYAQALVANGATATAPFAGLNPNADWVATVAPPGSDPRSGIGPVQVHYST